MEFNFLFLSKKKKKWVKPDKFGDLLDCENLALYCIEENPIPYYTI